MPLTVPSLWYLCFILFLMTAATASLPAKLSEQRLAITSSQEEALARLLPALLCGEQSAIAVFHAEALRLSQAARSASLAVFGAIEADEGAHEVSLQILANTLPTAPAGTYPSASSLLAPAAGSVPARTRSSWLPPRVLLMQTDHCPWIAAQRQGRLS